MLKAENSDPIIGLTSTVPMEIIFAADLRPLDLNNIFISSPFPEKFINQAEADGFGHSVCSWIKGIYATVLNYNLKRIIGVTGGDCSNTIALSEILSRKGVEVIHFDYPLNRDRNLLAAQMDRLRRILSTTWTKVGNTKVRIDRIRNKLKMLDKMTYEKNVVTGFENHLFHVSSSDFNSDIDTYEHKLDLFLLEAENRKPRNDEIRLGYLGVPPIFSQFYELIESMGARVVFNETQRQFSMPYEEDDIIDQYLSYTYPYDIQGRIVDILQAISERQLDGLIHYTQTFCFRQIYDIILRDSLPLPILTLEGDRPGPVDSRTALRIETFIHILKEKKYG